jgi:hypothetical protein
MTPASPNEARATSEVIFYLYELVLVIVASVCAVVVALVGRDGRVARSGQRPLQRLDATKCVCVGCPGERELGAHHT